MLTGRVVIYLHRVSARSRHRGTRCEAECSGCIHGAGTSLAAPGSPNHGILVKLNRSRRISCAVGVPSAQNRSCCGNQLHLSKPLQVKSLTKHI